MIQTAPHYTVIHLDNLNGKADPDYGREQFLAMFGDGEVNDMNFVLFSTSGVHGTYRTIEEIEEWFTQDEETRDEHGDLLTVLVVHPRLVCLRCAHIRVQPQDIPLLKGLRRKSMVAVQGIGF